MPRVCDYEGSQYRTEFWEDQNRRYEDLAERVALRHLLPPHGNRLIEVGAGFGRLADLYAGYRQVVLMDYARTQLEEAQRYLGRDERFIFVVADVYQMPFVDDLFDALVMVRVMHHLADVPAALRELQRIIQPAGAAVVEHANKRHLKAILRWWLGRQNWNPFSLEPYEFAELNIDFHPAWMRRQLTLAGLKVDAARTVSHFRLPRLKRLLPPQLLARLDGLMQPTGRWFQYAPSIFLKARPQKISRGKASGFFRCPHCLTPDLQEHAVGLICATCQRRWAFEEGIYDFKTPLNA